jgi:hypothetical protein
VKGPLGIDSYPCHCSAGFSVTAKLTTDNDDESKPTPTFAA